MTGASGARPTTYTVRVVAYPDDGFVASGDTPWAAIRRFRREQRRRFLIGDPTLPITVRTQYRWMRLARRISRA